MLLTLVGEEFRSGQCQARGDDPLDAGDAVRVSVLCSVQPQDRVGRDWGARTVQSSRGVDTTSPSPSPQVRAVAPGSEHSTRPPTLGPWSKVGKKQRLGQAGSWVRVGQAGLGVSEEDDSAPFLRPEGERLWHIRGRPLPLGIAWGQLEPCHCCPQGPFLTVPHCPPPFPST